MDTSVDQVQRVRFWSTDPRVRGIVDNVADAVIAIDIHGNIEMFNPVAERLFGYPSEEVMGRNIKLLAGPDYSRHHDEYLARYLETKEPHIIGIGREVEGRRKDGTVFPIYLSVGEIEVAEFHGFIGIIHDLTAQKEVEKALLSARAHLQDIIDSMPSILVGVDEKGIITHWNRSAAAERGMDIGEGIGQPLVKLFPFLERQLGDISGAIRERHPVRKERLPLQSGSGNRFIDLVVYPLSSADALGGVVRIDDVTERVRIEEMMVQTEKMMSVGGLAAGMAHEINNPLGIIAQSCQNLVRRLSDEIPKNREVADNVGLDLEAMRRYMTERGLFQFIAGMQEATERAGRIVTEMLAYSRRSTSSFVPTSLPELVETVLHLASHDYDVKKNYDFRRITIERDYDVGSDLIFCEAMAIEQVLLNLLKNAAQAMAGNPLQTSPTITLRLREEEQWLRLEVIDNGPGISAEVRHRLFEPFFTTKPVGMGTGLGLAVAYFIVTEQHHGRLEVDSIPGKGSKFTLRLPRHEEH
ncbi:PAS domain-containing sensor histidine kinase [Sedimenticola hydrogenitrophicus]|uniref:PAS domain-containing sensor histidine kinase n=1 Tax=Sedimenticola hydrogenitrophicus TaxID=2967975 RepID=UPI0021A2A7E6|nr:PAS domain-containing sensor histidine kinase [Sedimenticola hydrogenitrophicus]